jgi:hypothetical protein
VGKSKAGLLWVKVDLSLLEKYQQIEKDMIAGDSIIQLDLKKKEYELQRS